MVAGAGERKTLRLAARCGDACGLYPTPDLPHKLDVLRRHCEAEGRDYDRIEKTCIYVIRPGERPRETVDGLRGLATLGIETAYLHVPDAGRIEPVDVIGREIIPAVADL